MIDNFILYPETLNYLSSVNQFTDAKLLELEKIALKEKQPIIQRELALFLMMLCKIKQAKRILELGTNIGFSALCMSSALNHNVKIDTIEFNEKNVKRSRENLPSNVTVHHQAALDYLRALKKTDLYDFVFIDANKKENQSYIELLEKHLEKNALICIDNILWKGRTTARALVDEQSMDSTEAIRKFNIWMTSNPSFSSQILAIGDGILLAYKN